MNVTALQVAQQWIGEKELAGPLSNPLVLAMLRLDAKWVEDDVTPWCSAFVGFVCKCLPGVERSRSLAARSWLLVGKEVSLAQAKPGWDVVVLTRGTGKQPGKDVIAASGHVGFYVGQEGPNVLVLGGNQGDAVSIAPFAKSRILRISRLREE